MAGTKILMSYKAQRFLWVINLNKVCIREAWAYYSCKIKSGSCSCFSSPSIWWYTGRKVCTNYFTSLNCLNHFMLKAQNRAHRHHSYNMLGRYRVFLFLIDEPNYHSACSQQYGHVIKPWPFTSCPFNWIIKSSDDASVSSEIAFPI